jgi:hypothetical protein
MRPISVTVGPLAAAVVNNIATSQTPGAAGALTLNGSLVKSGVAYMDSPRRVLITTTDTTHTFTITGTTPTGSVISESFLVTGGATASQLDYSTVTKVTISGAATAAVQVGTNGIASSPWVRLDEWADSSVGVQCDVSGTVNYTVQSTFDDPNSPTNPVPMSAVNWIPTNDTNAVGATASIQTNFLFAPTFVRILLSSGTGTVTATIAQYNVTNR